VKLRRLKIKGFKNLTGANGWFELDFTSKDGITVLIGNNGSGKSNVLEAISAIFYDLYNFSNTRKKIYFDFEIEYEINSHHVQFSFSDEEQYKFLKYNGYGREEEISTSNIERYLPSNILMIYSGDDIKLFEQYYKPFTAKFQKIIKDGQEIPTLPKMLYIDKFFWTIALLSLLKSDLDDNKEFCKKTLKNDSLQNIKILFEFDEVLIQKQTSFLNQLSNGQSEQSYLLEEFKSLDYLPYEKDLFVHLTSMVGQRKRIKKLRINNNGIDTIHLSEGEKKQILIRVALDILADQDSLVLLDEADAYIHVSNKLLLKKILKEYTNRESILTTHSPTLTHSFDEKHITMINQGQIEDRQKQEVFSQITDGIWNYQEQSIFLSSSKNIILLVEGKHDKIHIEEAFKRLKGEYTALEFDTFQMHGEANIKHMLLGLANNGVDFNNKKVIAIFDNDKAGQEAFSKNFKKIDGKTYKQLTDNEGNSSNIFFGFLLPKTQNYTSDFTIENMYDGERYKNALTRAFANRTDNHFFNNFVDDISKQIKEDAKNQLAEDCKEFSIDDFTHFRQLFNLTEDIKDFTIQEESTAP
jgi:predicted ATP-dependent endonuclease of OLD family